MIALILTFIISIVPLNAQVDDEFIDDHVIDMTRELFKKGRAPTRAELFPEARFACTQWIASLGQSNWGTGLDLSIFKFRIEAGVVSNVPMLFGPRVSRRAIERSDALEFADGTGGGLFVRIYQGRLIAEWAKRGYFEGYPSISIPGVQAAQYFVCRPYFSDLPPGSSAAFGNPVYE